MSTTQSLQGVVVYDLASVRFRFGPNRRSVSVVSAAGEHLALVPASPSEDSSTVAFRALTEAMKSSRVLRVCPFPEHLGEVLGHAVAFYNPYTAQISYTDAAGSAVFVADGPIALPADGLVMRLSGEPQYRSLSGLAHGLDGPNGEVVEAYERRIDSFEASKSLAAYA